MSDNSITSLGMPIMAGEDNDEDGAASEEDE
jgi:hypothetical protein